MCGGGPDNHHAIAVAAAADLPPPPSVVAVEMAPPHGHRPGKEVYNEEGDDDEEYDGREFEEEFLRFCMMVDEEDDDDDDDEVEIIAVVSPPRRPLVGARGTTSAVESVTNLQARTSPLPNPVVPQTGTKASKRGGGAKPAAAKKRRSKHGFLGVHQRTYGRWSAEIRDNVIKGSRFWIGTFDTALEAALAYDAVSCRLYGLNAKTNFPAAAAGEDLPPPPPPPVAKPCSSTSKRQKKCNSTSGDHGAAAPPQAVDTPAAAAGGVEVELTSQLLCSVAAQAQEVSDGWEFIQELLLLGGGVSPLDYLNGQDQLVGADLWSF